jgi:hypothetical protein
MARLVHVVRKAKRGKSDLAVSVASGVPKAQQAGSRS